MPNPKVFSDESNWQKNSQRNALGEFKIRGQSFRDEGSVTRKSAGFSALELLVVMVIITILGAITYPILGRLAPVYRLEGATRSVAMQLQKARGRAIAEGKCFQLTFDTTAKTFQVLSKPGSSSCVTSVFQPDGLAMKIDDADSLIIDDGSGAAPTSPVFNTQGKADPTSHIVLHNRNQAVRQVFVQTTGRVYVQ